MNNTKGASILYGEADAQVMSAQARVLEKAGYVVVAAVGREAVAGAMARTAFDLVILGHTLTKDDRHHLAYTAKKLNPASRVLVLHASGKHPKVDLAIDSRRGEAAVLEAVAELIAVRAKGRAAAVA